MLSFAWTAPLSLALLELLKFLRFEPPITGATQFTLGTSSSLPRLPAYFESAQVWLMVDTQGYFAIDAICTHLGCTVRMQPSGDELRCPCHGSRFDFTGAVLQGPATRSLPFVRLYWGSAGQLTADRATYVDPAARLPV